MKLPIRHFLDDFDVEDADGNDVKISEINAALAQAERMREALEEIAEDASSRSSSLYCNAIGDASHNPLLLGKSIKLRAGLFCVENLRAHCANAAAFSESEALAEMSGKIRAALAPTAPEEEEES